MNSYTAIIQKSGSWWVGWIAEVQGVNCQERTKQKLLESLQETLSEAIEMNRLEALATISKGYTQAIVMV